jgi:DNA-directed RNA polymerase beta' subunit
MEAKYDIAEGIAFVNAPVGSDETLLVATCAQLLADQISVQEHQELIAGLHLRKVESISYSIAPLSKLRKMAPITVTHPYVDSTSNVGTTVMSPELRNKEGLILTNRTFHPQFVQHLPHLLSTICLHNDCHETLFKTDGMTSENFDYDRLVTLWDTIKANFCETKCINENHIAMRATRKSEQTLNNVICILNSEGVAHQVTARWVFDKLINLRDPKAAMLLGFGAVRVPQGEETEVDVAAARLKNNELMAASFIIEAVRVPRLTTRLSAPNGPLNPLSLSLDKVVTRNQALSDYFETHPLEATITAIPTQHASNLEADLYVAIGNVHKEVRKVMDRKDGDMRGNAPRKRQIFSARSVTSPAPNNRPDELSLPESWATILTPRVRITGSNITAHTLLQRRGKLTSIMEFTERTGTYVKVPTPAMSRYVLKPGDSVFRHLRNGDLVLAVRNPTLQTQGMLMFKVLLWNQRTIGIALSVYAGYAGDFDGDTISVFLPQSAMAKLEGRFINVASANYLSRVDGDAMNGATYDAPLALYLMTVADERGEPMDSHTFTELAEIIREMPYFDSLIERLGRHGVPLHSGRGILSATFPPDFTFRNRRITIVDGVLLSGAPTVQDVQSGGDCLVKHMERYGEDVADVWVHNATAIANVYVKRSSTSLGYADMMTMLGDEDHEAVVQHATLDAKASGSRQIAVVNRMRPRDGATADELAKFKLEHTAHIDAIENETTAIIKDASIKQDERRDNPDKGIGIKDALKRRMLDRIERVRREGLEPDVASARENAIINETGSELLQISLAQLRRQRVYGRENYAVIKSASEDNKQGKVLNAVASTSAQGGPMHIDGAHLPLSPYDYNTVLRTLPGHIFRSLSEGFTPIEVFYQAVAARKSLVDQISTSIPGALDSRFKRAADNLVVDSNGAVRWADGRYVQLLYGGDGLHTPQTWRRYADSNKFRTVFNMKTLSDRLAREGGYDIISVKGKRTLRGELDKDKVVHVSRSEEDIERDERIKFTERKRRKLEAIDAWHRPIRSQVVYVSEDHIKIALESFFTNARGTPPLASKLPLPLPIHAGLHEYFLRPGAEDDVIAETMKRFKPEGKQFTTDSYTCALGYVLHFSANMAQSLEAVRPTNPDLWLREITGRVVAHIVRNGYVNDLPLKDLPIYERGDLLKRYTPAARAEDLVTAMFSGLSTPILPVPQNDPRYNPIEMRILGTRLAKLQPIVLLNYTSESELRPAIENWVAVTYVVKRRFQAAQVFYLSQGAGSFTAAMTDATASVRTELERMPFEDLILALNSNSDDVFNMTDMPWEEERNFSFARELLATTVDDNITAFMYQLHMGFVPAFPAFGRIIRNAGIDAFTSEVQELLSDEDRFISLTPDQTPLRFAADLALQETARFNAGRYSTLHPDNPRLGVQAMNSYVDLIGKQRFNAAFFVKDATAMHIAATLGAIDTDLFTRTYTDIVKRVARVVNSVLDEWYHQTARTPDRKHITTAGIPYLFTALNVTTGAQPAHPISLVPTPPIHMGDLYAFEHYVYVIFSLYEATRLEAPPNDNQIAAFDTANITYATHTHDMESHIPPLVSAFMYAIAGDLIVRDHHMKNVLKDIPVINGQDITTLARNLMDAALKPNNNTLSDIAVDAARFVAFSMGTGTDDTDAFGAAVLEVIPQVVKQVSTIVADWNRELIIAPQMILPGINHDGGVVLAGDTGAFNLFLAAVLRMYEHNNDILDVDSDESMLDVDSDVDTAASASLLEV